MPTFEFRVSLVALGALGWLWVGLVKPTVLVAGRLGLLCSTGEAVLELFFSNMVGIRYGEAVGAGSRQTGSAMLYRGSRLGATCMPTFEFRVSLVALGALGWPWVGLVKPSVRTLSRTTRPSPRR